jgi:hypothetical protein
VRYLLTRI